MTPPLFLVRPDRLASDLVVLDGPEGRHAATVRRITAGELVELSDGAGGSALCEVREVGRDALTCAVLRRSSVPAAQPRIVVVQALAKAAEQAVETMTEVGIDEIVPWYAERSVVRWRGERVGRGLARWRVTAREAAKQSRRVWLPAIPAPASTAEVAARIAGVKQAYVLDSAGADVRSVGLPDRGDVVVIVGPEGGLTRSELDAFGAAGAAALQLGPTVLRSATAGTVAAAALLSRTSRWGRG